MPCTWYGPGTLAPALLTEDHNLVDGPTFPSIVNVVRIPKALLLLDESIRTVESGRSRRVGWTVTDLDHRTPAGQSSGCVPKAYLVDRLSAPDVTRMVEACGALRAAVDC